MSKKANADVDPGWGPVLKALPTLVIPFFGMRTMASQDSGLQATRLLWLVFVNAIVVFWLPVVLLGATDGAPVSTSAGVAIVLVVGVALQLAAPRVMPAPDGSSAQALAQSFQRATLVRIAFAEAAAIVGLVFFLLTGSWVVYGVAFVIAGWGIWQAAPSTARLEQVQADIAGRGSDLHLVRVLNTTRLTR